MVAILYRYAQSKKYDVSVGENTKLLGYSDAGSVSEYAVPAMQWACGAGLINGSDGKLMPQGDAQRAQVAAILMRFSENIAKAKYVRHIPPFRLLSMSMDRVSSPSFLRAGPSLQNRDGPARVLMRKAAAKARGTANGAPLAR